MLYNEAAFFDGQHCQHCADWLTHSAAKQRKQRAVAHRRESRAERSAFSF